MPTIDVTHQIPPMIEALIALTAAIAVVTDLRQRRIYNAVTFPAMATGLAFNGVLSGSHGVFLSASGLLLAGLLFVIPVALGGMGAGDLKLVAALGALGGPVFAFWCVIFASIAGGVFAVMTLLVRRQFVAVTGGMALAVFTQQPVRATSGIRIPFALPIAAGAMTALMLR